MTNIVKLVKVLSQVGDKIFQVIRCNFQNRNQDLKIANSYGHYFNPPANSFGIALAVSGHDSDVHVIVDKPELRYKGLLPGEVKDGNTVIGSYVHYKADGSIEIKALPGQAVNIIADNVTVTGNITAIGTVTAANFISTGGVAAYNGHTHSGVDTGVGNTGGPN